MEKTFIERIARLRAAVGFLGEKDQCGWWQSSFFSTGGKAFLAPAVPRTVVLAQCSGVTAAAASVHDDRIGVGRVYHLFRLPEDIEQRIHVALSELELAESIELAVANQEAARSFLRSESGSPGEAHVGPWWVGDLSNLRLNERWQDVATQYLVSIESGEAVFPYFADRG
jgi:hypothetical protein